MNGEEKLRLSLKDVYREGLKGKVNLYFEHATLRSANRVAPEISASSPRTITNLHSGVYKLSVYPTRYYPIKRVIMIQTGQLNREMYTFAVDPEKVIRIEAPQYAELKDDLKQVLENSQVESHPHAKGEDLYTALDDIRKAGLLNIYSKMKATVFQNERNAFSYVRSLTRVRGDRFFAHVEIDLRDEVKNSIPSTLFKDAPNLDHTPPLGYSNAGSFKTQDKYGNLQLTFFFKSDFRKFMIDADIDDASGILHTFQVIEHYITGEGTHPYDIHEILLQHQKLDPGYRFVV